MDRKQNTGPLADDLDERLITQQDSNDLAGKIIQPLMRPVHPLSRAG